jgi:hypothetical protein
MKNTTLVRVGIVLLFSILANHTLFGQNTTGAPAEVQILTWFYSNPQRIDLGIMFAIFGLVGALCTIFFAVGSSLPAVAGQNKIDSDAATLEEMSQNLKGLVANPLATTPETITAVQKAVNSHRDDLRSERWRQFFVGSVLYGILGAAVATMLAQTILQALIIGAGWTGFVGSLGVKYDYAKRKAIKDEVIKDLLEALGLSSSSRNLTNGVMSAEKPENPGKDNLSQRAKAALNI